MVKRKKKKAFGHCYYYGCHNGMTKLYKCKYCEKYFCKDHLDPTIPSVMSKSLPAHPCAQYRIWREDKEKIEIGRRLDSLNKLKEVWFLPSIHKKRKSFIPFSKPIRPKFPKKDIELPVSKRPTHKNLLLSILVILVVSTIVYLFVDYNIAGVESGTETLVTYNNVSLSIPYILNYPAKRIYFPSEYSDVNESLIGTPIKEKLDDGWMIEYEDYPEHNTTSQRIVLKYTTTETIVQNTESPRESMWSKIMKFFSTFSFGETLNCTDGTFYNRCSTEKPYYCLNGTLIKNSTTCGCPYDYRPRGNDCELIPRCSDRTVYGECSTSKPYYCLSGELIKKSSLCGCVADEVSQEDDCVSKFQVGPKKIELSYFDGYITYTVYQGLNDYLAGLSRTISYYEGEAPPTTKDFIMRKLDNVEQNKMLDPFVDEIKKLSNDKDIQAKIAIRLVQLIPYDWDAFTSDTVTGKYPYEVLYTNTGVCSEKSELLVYLLRGLGYGVAVLQFEMENHEVVGIKCPSQYTYKDTGYCFVESTSLTSIGDSSGYYVGVGQLTSNPEVIKISDGYSLNSI